MRFSGLLSNLQRVHFKNIYKNEIFTESLALVWITNVVFM